jgi:hypothetical protein
VWIKLLESAEVACVTRQSNVPDLRPVNGWRRGLLETLLRLSCEWDVFLWKVCKSKVFENESCLVAIWILVMVILIFVGCLVLSVSSSEWLRYDTLHPSSQLEHFNDSISTAMVVFCFFAACVDCIIIEYFVCLRDVCCLFVFWSWTLMMCIVVDVSMTDWWLEWLTIRMGLKCPIYEWICRGASFFCTSFWKLCRNNDVPPVVIYPHA